MERRAYPDSDSYFNNRFPHTPIDVPPGRHACTRNPDHMLVARVGSGVALCVHDTELGLGGMAHILLPLRVLETFPIVDRADPSFRFAEDLIERFMRDIKAQGAGKNRIRIKLIGGSTLFEDMMDCGLKNYVFAKEQLLQKGLRIASEDIGGPVCRRVHYIPFDGRIISDRLHRQSDIHALHAEESLYLKTIEDELIGGEPASNTSRMIH